MLSDVKDLFQGAAVQPATDRRLSRRVADHWARLARGRFPCWESFRELDLQTDWEWIFAVDVERSIGFPYFIYLGEKLAKLSDVFLCGETDWATTLLETATADVFATVAEEGPNFRDDSLTLCDGRPVQFRVVTLPLSDDGQTITHVVGAANGRFSPMAPLHAI